MLDMLFFVKMYCLKCFIMKMSTNLHADGELSTIR